MFCGITSDQIFREHVGLNKIINRDENSFRDDM